MSQVKVAVRVRPMNDREKELGCKNVIEMDGPYTILKHPTITEGPNAQKVFAFDYSYWSYDTTSHKNNYADQQKIFQDLGVDILNNAFEGFNCCIFAYGQTGAGKSYSMLGYSGQEGKGLIPRVCEAIFDRLKMNTDPHLTHTVEVSFMEIYNETVKDLLVPKNNKKGGLKVRNHPKTGPYVEDLAKLPVTSYEEIERLMDDGIKSRTVAATTMNPTSSRSHAVFTIVLTQTVEPDAKGFGGRQIISKIHMVDLAGSERAGVMENARLKEGANINKSLSTLGKVISALAKKANTGQKVFVPYRDSVLTWLLKESLGGNSKTIMLAAISPADINYEETLSTLRYADSAKKIKNKAIINEDPTNKLIRELQEEVERLRGELMAMNKMSGPFVGLESNDSENKDRIIEILQAKLQQNEKYITTFKDSQFNRVESKDMSSVIQAVSRLPHLVDLSGNSGTLVHYLEKGETLVGMLVDGAERTPDVSLQGLNIHAQHCLLDHRDDGTVWIIPLDGVVFVNGIRISHARRLTHGCRVIFGTHHVFRFVHPEEAAHHIHHDDDTYNHQLIDLNFAFSERAVVEVESFFSEILRSDMSSEDERELERRIKEFNIIKERERNQIQRQLVLLRTQFERYMQQLEQQEMQATNNDTRLNIAQQKEELYRTFAREHYELQMMMKNVTLTYYKQQETLARLAIQIWNDKMEHHKLQQRIVLTAKLIDEATAIVKTLALPLLFTLELYNSFPEAHNITRNRLFSSSEAELFLPLSFGHCDRINVGVKVTNLQSGAQCMIDSSTFQERVRLMREFRQAHFNNDTNSKTDSNLNKETSPFYFPPPSSKQLVGMAYFNLKDLLYFTQVTRSVVILDSNGNSLGTLTLSISRVSMPRLSNIVDMNRDPLFDDEVNILSFDRSSNLELGEDVEFTICIQSATGLPLDRFTDITCHLLFHDQSFLQTPVGTKKENVLVFEHSFQFEVRNISEEFLSYLQHDALRVELWGQLSSSARDVELHHYHQLNKTPENTYHLLATLRILEQCNYYNASNNNTGTEFVCVTTQRMLFAEPPVLFRLYSHCTLRRITLYLSSINQHSPLTLLSCEAATIGKFRQINSLIDNEHSTADQKRMFPLKVLQITSTSVELEWDMTAVVDSPTLSSFLLPSSKSHKRGRTQRYRSKKEVLNDVVIQKQGNEKIVAQLELVLTFAEFSTPVNISKCIAFKYVHSERLTRQETDAWLQQFISNERNNMHSENCTQFHISIVQSRHLDALQNAQHINNLIEEQRLRLKHLETAVALSKFRQELELHQKLTSLTKDSNKDDSMSCLSSASPILTEQVLSPETLVQVITNLEKQMTSLPRRIVQQGYQPTLSWLAVQVDEFQVFNFESKKSGFLAKKNRRDEWKLWWFVLTHSYLAYFARQDDAKPKGVFDLSNVSVISLPSDHFNTHCFAVVNVSRVWILQATSAEEMHSWIEAIDPTKKFKETIEREKKQTKAQIDQAYQEVKAHQEKIIALSKELDALIEENQILKHQNAQLRREMQEKAK